MNKMISRFERNTKGRDLIVGDIHGHFTKLKSALDDVGFDPDAGDRLFSVGDLVDRGPESDDALAWLAKPWFFAVQGNHEDMAIRWPNGNMDPGNYAVNGGSWNIGNPPELRLEIAEAFRALPIAMEIETVKGVVGVIHAGCPLQSWQDLARIFDNPHALTRRELGVLIDACMWSRDRITKMDDSIVSGVRAVVVGHTPMERMTSLGNTLFIDTAGWHPRGHGFTIIDAATLGRASRPVSGVAA